MIHKELEEHAKGLEERFIKKYPSMKAERVREVIEVTTGLFAAILGGCTSEGMHRDRKKILERNIDNNLKELLKNPLD